MRYVEQWVTRLTLALALALALALCVSGCATNPASGTSAPVAAVDPAAVSAKAVGGASGAEVPVDAAAQRSFDEARRALSAGQFPQAESGFLGLTKSHPQLAGPHAGLGLIYLLSGKLPEAIGELELAVAASPKQPAYLNQLGVAYRQDGQFDKARQAYEKTLQMAPDHAEAVLNLGILNDLYLGDSSRALELYERYLLLTPAGDATVTKWVVDLKNRKPQTLAAKGKS